MNNPCPPQVNPSLSPLCECTCSGENLVGLITDKLCDSGPQCINCLLHGFDSNTQVIIFSLKHSILMKHVINAFYTLLINYSFTLEKENISLLVEES